MFFLCVGTGNLIALVDVMIFLSSLWIGLPSCEALALCSFLGQNEAVLFVYSDVWLLIVM